MPQDCKPFGSPVPFPALPLGEDLSTQLSTGPKEDDDGDTFLEEVVRITRYPTVSSEQTEDSDNSIMQCCLCGKRTLERCLECAWAPYCSLQCFKLHRPIHQYFCYSKYAQIFPRLTGLDVVSIQRAVKQLKTQNGSRIPNDRRRSISLRGRSPKTSPRFTVSTPNFTNEPTLTEIGLIQKRARLIQSYWREAGGQAMCAICGDLCLQSKQSTRMPGETRSMSELADPLRSTCVSGDSKGTQAIVQRLVRFAGMLVCTTCIAIQASDM